MANDKWKLHPSLSPRRILEGLLRGTSAPRPLFLPNAFSLGARLVNLPLRTYLGDATKISGSLRQIQTHVRSDGFSCYFDPYVEVEALGGTLEWDADDGPPRVRWPGRAEEGDLPEGLHSVEDALKRGRVGVAVDVIRRLKALVRDDFLLTAGVTGPFSLASRITGLRCEDSLQADAVSDHALDVAAEMITQVSRAFAEAGANVVFIQEDGLPTLTPETCEAWASRLAPSFNVIRFYEALPVLHLTDHRSFSESREVVLERRWDCVVCPALGPGDSLVARIPEHSPNRDSRFVASHAGGTPALSVLGISLPLDLLERDNVDNESFARFFDNALSQLSPAVVTATGVTSVGLASNRLRMVSERLAAAR